MGNKKVEQGYKQEEKGLNLIYLNKCLKGEGVVEVFPIEKITEYPLFAKNEIETSKILIGNIGKEIPERIEKLLEISETLVKEGDKRKDKGADRR